MTARQQLHAEMYRAALESYRYGNLDDAWMCVADCEHHGADELRARIDNRLANRAYASEYGDEYGDE